jgi:CBS domain containing-hemolysin-like protein
LLLFSNGFFVASEFAIVKVRKTRMEQLSKEGNSDAKLALKAIEDLDKFIAAVQLGVTISSIGLGWVGEATLAKIIEPLFRFLPGI